ncbi:hypothetical protein [Rubritalea tangerina]
MSRRGITLKLPFIKQLRSAFFKLPHHANESPLIPYLQMTSSLI